jgi:hypothetical protein
MAELGIAEFLEGLYPLAKSPDRLRLLPEDPPPVASQDTKQQTNDSAQAHG